MATKGGTLHQQFPFLIFPPPPNPPQINLAAQQKQLALYPDATSKQISYIPDSNTTFVEIRRYCCLDYIANVI